MTATPTPTTAPQPVRPVPALQAALAAEHTAVYGYGIAGALLTGGDQAAAVADWRTHEQARDTLEAMIVKLGATPVAASPAYALPFAVNDARSARRLAAALEDGVTQAYLGLVAVSDTTLRTFGALAMQPPAQRAAAWRGSTVAFPGMGALVSAWGSADNGAGPGRTSVPVLRQGKHPSDGSRGRVKVVSDRDPLRPRPPEPPHAVPAAVGVHILLECPRPGVHDIHARLSPRRRHQPGLKPAVRQFVDKLVEIDRLCVVPLSFHRLSPLLPIVVSWNLTCGIVSACACLHSSAARSRKSPPGGQNSVAFIYGTEQSSAGTGSACKIVNLDTARVSAT
jgi:hypothetical protein